MIIVPNPLVRTQTKIAIFFTSIVVLIFTVFGFVFHGYVRSDFQARQALEMLEDIIEDKTLEQIRDNYEHITIQHSDGGMFCEK